MNKSKKDHSFIKQPYYKGGDKSMSTYINENIVFPEISRVNQVEGTVHLRYDIDHKGKVIDVKIISGLDDACNQEAIRVVKMLTFVVPKTPRHLKVTFHKVIRIHFALHSAIESTTEEDQTKNPSHQDSPHQVFHYNIVTPLQNTQENKDPTPVSYTFTYKIQ
ncbi:MAG: TonB family protein [Saprospiraceae bacterium]